MAFVSPFGNVTAPAFIGAGANTGQNTGLGVASNQQRPPQKNAEGLVQAATPNSELMAQNNALNTISETQLFTPSPSPPPRPAFAPTTLQQIRNALEAQNQNQGNSFQTLPTLNQLPTLPQRQRPIYV